MRAVSVKQPGGVEQLQISKFQKPVPKQGEILVKVMATAVNRTDIVNREGKSGYNTNRILGIEVAGEVVDVAQDTNVEKGARVMGLVNGGAYAEYAIMPANRAMIVPDNLSFDEAAAIPEVFLTAYQTLFWLGELTDGDTVLIHAGGSGVGTAAIQLAKQLTNATVITTAGTAEKLDYCRSLGADVCINYKEESFPEEVLKVTNDQGADLILDFIGASYWKGNLKSIRTDGRWILIGVLGGTEVEKVNLMHLMLKRVQLKGTLLTPRSDEYKQQLTQDFSKSVLPLIQENKIKPIIDKIFKLEDVQEAHRHMEENKNIGKIILHVNEEG